jgi:hypothetical protein
MATAVEVASELIPTPSHEFRPRVNAFGAALAAAIISATGPVLQICDTTAEI